MSYDSRFVHVFLAKLKERSCPVYPAPEWFEALQAADLEQPCTTPPIELKALIRPKKVQPARDLAAAIDYDWKTQHLVRLACDRWCKQYGPT